MRTQSAYTDRPVHEGMAHAIPITVVDPRRAEDALLRQIYVVARATEKKTLRVCIEGRTECLCSRLNPLTLGVVADIGVVAAAPPDGDPARPVISSRV